MRRNLHLFLILFLVPAIAWADTVVLRNGKTLTGRILSQSRTRVRIATSGGVRSVAKGQIRRITYGGGGAAAKAAEERRRKRIEAARKEREERRKAREEQKKQAEAEQAAKAESERERDRRQAEAERQTEEELRASEAAVAARPPLDWAAIGRSAVIPGWGQSYRGRGGAGFWSLSFAGGLVGAVAAGRLVFSRTRDIEAIQAQRNLLWLINTDSGGSANRTMQHLILDRVLGRAQAGANRMIVAANSFAGVAATIYLANLIDVALYAAPGEGAALRMGAGPQGGWFAYEVRF